MAPRTGFLRPVTLDMDLKNRKDQGGSHWFSVNSEGSRPGCC